MRIDRRMSIEYTNRRNNLKSARKSKNINLESISNFVRRNSKVIMEHQSKNELMKTIQEVNQFQKESQNQSTGKHNLNPNSKTSALSRKKGFRYRARTKTKTAETSRTISNNNNPAYSFRSTRNHIRKPKIVLYHKSADILNSYNQLSIIRDKIEINLKKDRHLKGHIRNLSRSLKGNFEDLEYIEKFRKERLKSQLSIKSGNQESTVLIKKFQVYDKKKSKYFMEEVERFRREQLQVGHFLRMNSHKNEESLLLKKNKHNLKSLRKLVNRVQTKLSKNKNI